MQNWNEERGQTQKQVLEKPLLEYVGDLKDNKERRVGTKMFVLSSV